MPYQEPNHRRIPYDINGTVIGRSTSNSYENGITSWLSENALAELNDEDTESYGYNSDYHTLWFFFPERMEIEAGVFAGSNPSYYSTPKLYEVQGSNDTTNGMDGTWETAVFPSGNPFVPRPTSYVWRTDIKPISFSTSYKVIRMRFFTDRYYLQFIHLYGRKASGETPDDILICNTDNSEKTALLDWGDRPEGTTMIESFKLKNASGTKIAENVNLQLNHSDFGLSLSENGPWTATLDIASIAPDNISATIYIRNLLGAPPLILGPKAGRCIITVGSWT